nr:MAG TPA: hypothetical protein [Caudoviricetes sp.]
MFFDLIALSSSFFPVDFHITAAVNNWSRWKTTMTRR